MNRPAEGMAKRISLSRAARLVGVKRGVLQQQIRSGELQTFEGEIVLSDLLHAYPDAQIEDSSMLERVEQIIEQATFINPDSIARKPDNVALTARIMSFSENLCRHNTQKCFVNEWLIYCIIVCRNSGRGLINPGPQLLHRIGLRLEPVNFGPQFIGKALVPIK